MICFYMDGLTLFLICQEANVLPCAGACNDFAANIGSVNGIG